MAGDLNTLKSYIDTGDYQTAYNQARAAGYGLDDIASFVNNNYGTNWKGTDLASSYEKGSMANLTANNYRYANYDNGVGVGTPYNVPTAVNMYSPGSNSTINLTAQDYANYATDPTIKNQYTQVAARTSPGAVIGPSGGTSSAGGVPNVPNTNNNTNLTNYNQNTPQTELSLGLPALYPRRRADQSFNRGNNYFNMGSGNYQNRFA